MCQFLEAIRGLLQLLVTLLAALCAGGCGLMAWIPQQTQNTAQHQVQEVNQVGTQDIGQVNVSPPKVPSSQPIAADSTATG